MRRRLAKKVFFCLIRPRKYAKSLCFIGIIAVMFIFNFTSFSLNTKTKEIDFNSTRLVEPISFLDHENRLNNHQIIQNSHFLKFISNRSLTTSKNFLTIVVQVHNRTNYLKYVIESLRNVKYINESLLIFSHDFHTPEIDNMIEAIDFCATLRIFYPFLVRPNEQNSSINL